MKPIVAASLIALVGAYASPTAAGCGFPERQTKAQLESLMPGSLVCGRRITIPPGNAADRWQEEHLGAAPGGDLWDYKMGPNDKIDPRKKVGTWAIVESPAGSGQAIMRYVYSPNHIYEYTVHVIPPTANNAYSFCIRNGNELVRAFITKGLGPCAGYPAP